MDLALARLLPANLTRVVKTLGLLLVLILGMPVHALLPVAVDSEPLPSLAPMLEKVMPAVVNISTTSRINSADHPLLRDPFFRQFFPLREQRTNSLGSGVVVDADQGLVLTNHHVIDRADKIAVTLHDGRSLEGELVGSDEASDVAVIRIPTDNLQAIRIGSSESLRVGDFVVAIGNPFGLDQTVTSGIVSALGRSGLGIEGYEDFIQTDASINPGNSGGALVNLRGELVGINTAILSQSGGSVGIGLSIPIDMVGKLVDQLLEYGDIQRGLLGVATQDLTPQLAEAFGIDGLKGAVVSEVVAGSAAREIDLRSGDVIVRFDDVEIESGADLRNAIGVLRAGEIAEIQYFRDGRLSVASVTIRQPDQPTGTSRKTLYDSRFAGAQLEDVETAGGVQRGVRVVAIMSGSPASYTGLRPGDIIYNINRHGISGVDDLVKLASATEGELLVRLFRNDRPLLLVVR